VPAAVASFRYLLFFRAGAFAFAAAAGFFAAAGFALVPRFGAAFALAKVSYLQELFAKRDSGPTSHQRGVA
jgi:hypothetical protein